MYTRHPEGAIAVAMALAASVAGAEPVYGPGPYVLLDDALIARQERVTRRVTPPERLSEPVVTGPEDQCFQPYITVIRDASTGRFRIWYGVPENAGQSHLATMESEDGIHWIRPHQVLADPAPIQFGVSILDEGPGYAHPATRYKFGWWHGGGLQVAGSPDGLHWTRLGDGVVLPHNHDINCIYRDAVRDRYIALVSTYTEGASWTGSRRIPMQSSSPDLLHWSEPRVIIAPDERDEGETQYYCMDGLLQRGELLIGLLRVLPDDLPADEGGPVAGIGYTVLAWTRDGESWERDREAFMPRNPQPGSWDHAMTWGGCQLPVGDEVYIYYGGYAQGHKVNRFTERQIGLARMKRDRYVARSATSPRGTLATVPRRLNAAAMTLNASITGEVRVRVLGPDGHVWPGFGFDECRPLTGDGVALPVSWTRPLAELAGRTVAFEFALRHARLYAFDLVGAETRGGADR